MCLVAFQYRSVPGYPLILAANRDEFFDRPTESLEVREDGTIYCGLDQRAGGTWLGANRRGLFAGVTYFRSGMKQEVAGRSRGLLVMDYLRSSPNAKAFARESSFTAHEYGPFNFLWGDGDNLFYYTNRGEDGVVSVAPGVHAQSNGLLDAPWPKARRAKAALQELAAAPGPPDAEDYFALLADETGAPDRELPDTGIGLRGERFLAPIFIRGDGAYGTRSSSVLFIREDRVAFFYERRFDAGGKVLENSGFEFSMKAD